MTISDEQKQLAKLDKWLIDRCNQSGSQSVSVREVMQYGPSKLRHKSVLETAIAVLVEHDRVRLFDQERKKLIEVNPTLLSIGGTHA